MNANVSAKVACVILASSGGKRGERGGWTGNRAGPITSPWELLWDYLKEFGSDAKG